MKNSLIAKLLYDIADLLELQNVQFKPNAYRAAARTIEGMSKDIESEWKEGRLYDVPGVGKGIGEKIEEFLATEKSSYLEELKKKLPMDPELMNIEGMGPKKVMFLYKKLKIRTMKDLEESAKKGKIRKLPGFGEKSEQKILSGIEHAKKGSGRMLLGFALPIANEIISELRSSKLVTNAALAGSARRMKETVGDLDILAISSKAGKVMDYFCSMPNVIETISRGPTKASVRLVNGLQVDLRVLPEKEYGSALMYFTGNKDHNVALRKIAIAKKMKLSEYGLFKNNKQIAGKTEEEVYNKLGMHYIPPEMRENTGEVELALKNKLPAIVERKDVLCDLQMHSKWSDGSNTIEEMAAKAGELGHKYIAITDHAGTLVIANSMNEKRAAKYCEEIDSINKKSEIHILKGTEVNIMPSGSLDIPDKCLKNFDIVLCSVHSALTMQKEEMTKRILKAMDNKYMRIWAHPTGRKIKIRDGYTVDFPKIFDKAKERGIALEIDCYPDRTDLNDINVRSAVEAGVKLSIGTDAHAAPQLDFINLGVGTARRGWAKKSDIINTMPLEKMMKFLAH
ncbi:MAG: DNA polymerase/3'-5' exonuclease PolX [Candidatus Aenigmarchaeota archaeon]|nr:DNA polymerase/3'-5' exonuclease PolX [Candidatus Aenigmarchaeota archaeon]